MTISSLSLKSANIALVGMPGAGKTTIGKALANNLGWEFIDTDRLIEAKHGMSLQDIIDSQGKKALQQHEENIVLGLQAKQAIISTGGSVIFSESAIAHLTQQATIIYLDVNLQTLASRIDDFDARGLVKDPDQTLEDIFNERLPRYQAVCDYKIDNNLLDATQAEQAILTYLNRLTNTD